MKGFGHRVARCHRAVLFSAIDQHATSVQKITTKKTTTTGVATTAAETVANRFARNDLSHDACPYMHRPLTRWEAHRRRLKSTVAVAIPRLATAASDTNSRPGLPRCWRAFVSTVSNGGIASGRGLRVDKGDARMAGVKKGRLVGGGSTCNADKVGGGGLETNAASEGRDGDDGRRQGRKANRAYERRAAIRKRRPENNGGKCVWRTCNGDPRRHRVVCEHWHRIYGHDVTLRVDFDSAEECKRILGHDPWRRDADGLPIAAVMPPRGVPLFDDIKEMQKQIKKALETAPLRLPASSCPYAGCGGDDERHEALCEVGMDEFDDGDAWRMTREQLWTKYGYDPWQRDPADGRAVAPYASRGDYSQRPPGHPTEHRIKMPKPLSVQRLNSSVNKVKRARWRVARAEAKLRKLRHIKAINEARARGDGVALLHLRSMGRSIVRKRRSAAQRRRDRIDEQIIAGSRLAGAQTPPCHLPQPSSTSTRGYGSDEDGSGR